MGGIRRRRRKMTERERWEAKVEDLEGVVQRLREDVRVEIVQRVSAQRGLVPYVRSLDAFNVWLLQQSSAVQAAITPKLKELGLYGIRLGYDPDEDPNVLRVAGGCSDTCDGGGLGPFMQHLEFS